MSRRRAKNWRDRGLKPASTKRKRAAQPALPLPPQPGNIEQLSDDVDRTSREYERNQTKLNWKAFVTAMQKYNEACRAAFDEMERADG